MYFTSSEDSDCEDGRGPRRKVVRLDPLETTDGSMPNETVAHSEDESMEVNTRCNKSFREGNFFNIQNLPCRIPFLTSNLL